jgi:predicted cupin superfamily sugar epimerase
MTPKFGIGTPELRLSSKLHRRLKAAHVAKTVTLGGDLRAGERPQPVVLARAWQASRTLGDWTLVGCTVARGFEFAECELAPAGWEPGRA